MYVNLKTACFFSWSWNYASRTPT